MERVPTKEKEKEEVRLREGEDPFGFLKGDRLLEFKVVSSTVLQLEPLCQFSVITISLTALQQEPDSTTIALTRGNIIMLRFIAMASKASRSRKMKSAAYDKFKLVYKAVESTFAELVVSRPLILEHGFLDPTPPILQTILDRGWAHFYDEPYATVLQVIESNEYSLFNHAPFDSQETLDLLCGSNNGVWWKTREEKIINFPGSYLTQTSKVWHYFISARMLLSKNISEVTKDKALLNYAIQKGYTIDVGKLILSSILYIMRGSTSVGLGHPSLVYTLCVATRVRMSLGAQKPFQVNVRALELREAQDNQVKLYSGKVLPPHASSRDKGKQVIDELESSLPLQLIPLQGLIVNRMSKVDYNVPDHLTILPTKLICHKSMREKKEKVRCRHWEGDIASGIPPYRESGSKRGRLIEGSSSSSQRFDDHFLSAADKKVYNKFKEAKITPSRMLNQVALNFETGFQINQRLDRLETRLDSHINQQHQQHKNDMKWFGERFT
ncbi:hypothetical protein IEQ34_007758 [Dendrobium chrysotoxum]|uniref:Putative plant transposon protein domain-containing protein n=1 Tax=Dendrobium chrysotoxum TaxID=161865 RepID=A0AAV7H3X6_DENCH|nr:hypothetical protein IEQ34_007758 [Dendrobium chrysotoxum]